jgi:hypothetical protein
MKVEHIYHGWSNNSKGEKKNKTKLDSFTFGTPQQLKMWIQVSSKLHDGYKLTIQVSKV